MLRFYLICHIPHTHWINHHGKTHPGYVKPSITKLCTTSTQPRCSTCTVWCKRTLKLYCDASAYGLGACLVHVMDDNSEKPVVHASCTFTKSEIAYAQIEHEGLALVYGVCQFHQYFVWPTIHMVTDHCPLCKSFESIEITPTMAAVRQIWALIFSAYEHTIQHIKGAPNQCVDCMSKLPITGQSRDSTCNYSNWWLISNCIASYYNINMWQSTVHCHEGYPTQPLANRFISWHKSFYKRWHELSIVNGCISWETRTVILKIFHEPLLKELHCTHLGIRHMKSLVCSYFLWPHLDSQIKDISCNRVKCSMTSRNPPKAPAHPTTSVAKNPCGPCPVW